MRCKVGNVGDEELDDAIDSDIEKVRRTTCRTDFSEELLGCWSAGNLPNLLQWRPKIISKQLEFLRVEHRWGSHSFRMFIDMIM